MRILLVDIGNTNLKWAWLKDGEMSTLERSGYHANGITAQAYCCWSHADKPEKVVVANVAGQRVEDELQQWVTNEWRVDMEVVTATARQLGVKKCLCLPRATWSRSMAGTDCSIQK